MTATQSPPAPLAESPLSRTNACFEGFKASDRASIATHFSPALRHFRFIPKVERRQCAEALVGWADTHAVHEPVKRGYAMLVQAMDRFINEDLEAALRVLTASRAIFAEHDERDGLGLTAMLIGAIYRSFGNYDLALKVLWEGHELLKASGQYPIFVAANANSMANIHLDRNNLDEALAMFAVTHEESQRADDFYFTIYGLHGLGRVYMRQEKPAEAERSFQEALERSLQHDHPLMISNSLSELATFQFRLGDLESAESYHHRALEIRQTHSLLGGAVTNCVGLAEVYSHRAEWDKALDV
ncbi:MAG TPA: tetratricopeptide repeat protein, partial [Gemmatimonadaceae bacterium]